MALGLGLVGASRHDEPNGGAQREEEAIGNLLHYLTVAECEEVAGNEVFSGSGGIRSKVK